MNNDYKIELGIGLNTQEFNKIKNDIKSLEDKPIRLEIDAETKELTQSIQDALRALSKGGQNAFTIDTSKLDESIKDIKTAVLDLQKTFGSLGDNVNMKDLLSSVNQIANAIGKVTDESETLSKSLSALSKKDFGFNFNLKTGNANPVKSMADYGDEVRNNVIPQLEKRVEYFRKVLGGYENAKNELTRLMTSKYGAKGVDRASSLIESLGDDSSLSKQMNAYKKYLNYMQEIASKKNALLLNDYNFQFPVSPEELIADAKKIQSGTKDVEESFEKLKGVIGGGIGAEQLSTQLKPIVDDLHSIQEAITALSKDTSLGGLTASFNRLSESIENLLANAEKVKGVLNSGFDTNAIGADINSIKSPKSTRRRIQSEADEYLNGYLKHWNIKGENAKTVKGKFEAFSQVSSRGVGDELYETALDDLMNTLKQLGSVSKTADDDAKKLLATLKALSYMDEYDDLVRQQKELESALKGAEQQAKQTANSYEKISRSTSLVGNDDSFQKTFEASNQAAQEAQKHFQELLADEKAVVSVTEQFDDNNALQSFVVNIKRATGEVETLRYAMDKLNDEGDEGFAYQGGSSSDSRVEKQLEARIKKANDLQIKLDKIKTDYENMGANKPIKEKAHIESLSEQYDKVQAAIESVKKADESTYVSMVSNAEKEKAALESLVKVYRSAETFSTDLRAKDRDTAKEIYSSRLNVLSSKMKKDGVYDGLSSDVVALSGKITKASDVSALSEIANELAKLDAKYKSAKAAKDEFNRSQNVGSSVSGLRSEIEILQNASPSIKSFKTEINGAEVSIESLLKDLDRVSTKGDFDVVEGKVKAFSKAAEAAGIDLNEVKTEAKKANDAYKQMLDIQKEIRSLSIKEKNLTELGNTSELNEVSTKLKTLKSDYETLKRTFGGKLTSAQFGNLQAEIDETEAELKQLDAKFADIKAKLANDIKIKISDTGFNGFEQEVLRACNAAEELEGVYPDLEAALNRLDIAMEDVYSADQSGDVKRLVAANEEYENSLKQVYSQLKLYQQAEQKAYKNELLTQKKASLSSEMEIWLKDNTRAAKEFGDEIRRLQASLDGLDDKGVKLVGQQFKSIKKQAQAKGKTGLTAFDQIKSKFKEYSTYFSVAEMFMYAEQGLRSMFEAVKEIDTAMTGLYRVTDLTSAEYDSLFNKMIDSAKEYGATLNDIINATTDWVRAGFDANTSLGLAEVTTMYQHISDLDYDTAAENLITAYNGFKDELNGAFSGDTVSAVNYIADILNELDRHNCP